MPDNRSHVLLIEHDPELRTLNQVLLSSAGYHVTVAPSDADPLPIARNSKPNVIIVDVRPTVPQDEALIDRLQADPETRIIPIVVISTLEQTAAAATASPGVQHSVVAPYDVETLVTTVATALQTPPPASVMRAPKRAVPPAITFASEALSAAARRITLHTVQRLQAEEPYKSRFQELSRELVNNLGTVLGAVLSGIGRGHTPDEAFTIPQIRRVIREHSTLRKSQGIELASVVREYKLLQSELDATLQRLIGQDNFTADDAATMARLIDEYTHALVRIVTQEFNAKHN